jgi:hypothetical protein
MDLKVSGCNVAQQPTPRLQGLFLKGARAGEIALIP